MIQSFNCKLIVIIFLSVVVFSCLGNSKFSNNLDKQDTRDSLVIDKELYYTKIDSLVDLFNVNDSYTFFNKDQSYPIDDSLCYYFSKLNKREVIKDDAFRFLAGRLLEKLYLGERNLAEKPESFPVYNVSILTLGNRLSQRFALNIILNQETLLDSTFVKYAKGMREFVCIDSVVLILDKIPQMQNDSIHRICIDLVDRDKTGGCRW